MPRKLQKCVKEPKLHQGQICTKAKKAGQKVVKLVVQGSSVAKFPRLRKFATLPNSIVSSFSLAFLLQMPSEKIMHLRVRLGFVFFESAQRK